MMMYLLMGARGDYIDRWEYPIFVYNNEEQAIKERDLLNKILKDNKEMFDLLNEIYDIQYYNPIYDYWYLAGDMLDVSLETTLLGLIDKYKLPEPLHEEALNICPYEQRLYSIDSVRMRGSD